MQTFKRIAAIAAPPPKLTVSTWADAYRRLSSEASAEPGRWNTDRAPYQRTILDAICDPACERVVVMSSAQIGKTELLLNIIGYFIDYDPSPILLLQPTLEMAQTFSKDRLAPMLRDTPALKGKVADSKSKSSGNTMLHKPLALGTPIPTPEGWTTMGKVKVGDTVFGRDGKPAKVTYTTPILYDRECFELTFSDHSKVIADSEHPWPVKQWKVVKNKVKAKQVEFESIVSTKDIASNFKKSDRYRYRITACAPVELPEAALAIDPYVLGYWLGDGYSHKAAVACHNEDLDYVASRIAAAGHKVEAKIKPHRCPTLNIDINTKQERGASGRFISSRQGLGLELDKLGLLSKPGDGKSLKRIPLSYLRASVNQRFALLQGLMDSDGSARKDGWCVYSGTNYKLVSQVKELVNSLGFVCRIKQVKGPICTNTGAIGKDAYRAEFTATQNEQIFGLERKQSRLKVSSKKCKQRQIIDVKPVASVPVKCISVDHKEHLFLCGDSFIATHNTFPGGHITMAGANSPASLASRPIRILLADEVDRYPVSAGAEGDPVNLAIKRTTTFWNRKIVLVSTPTIRGASRIETAYEDSTQEIYGLPCPECGEFQQIRRQHLTHDKDETGNLIGVQAACEHCGTVHAEHVWKGQQGRWIAQADHAKTRGFHLNEYISPWRKWVDIETDFLQAKKSPETLKTFVNTSLGETWEEDEGEKLDHDLLYARREHYPAEVPIENCVLTAAVDTQDDRFEIDVVAWVAGEERYHVSYERLYGDLSRPDIWQLLARRLNRTFTTPNGNLLNVKLVCIDSGGHYTDEVYEFSKRFGLQKMIPLKGHSVAGKPIATYPRKRNKNGVYLTMVGTDTAKELVTDRLKIQEPGPGYVHWPINDAFDEDYFKQLTAERKKRIRGKVTWEAHGRRNESFDTAQYNLAAIRILQQHFGINLNNYVNTDNEEDEAEAQEPEQVTQKAPVAKAPTKHIQQDTGWLNI